ncbi:hypothetical protein SOVF_070310 [Spinacia oleracea]|uniref:DUF4378 domain-containing protein n=1 Tax=Spinacia oleracea TaxID=3562 RepID=A0A9R0J945_SPIOL|nr:uncharacterized protein LOC110801646 [Spinacia oleracea]KNA18472.1 hypothetical protein SOVF_070310 [Spinacia oleracea]
MSDLSARTSSALAITEKKPHIQRAGGCVGIFFQLFDWNRRFAKNKFFPKKLLPPVRTKVSKKFNAEEKLPVTKHLLIGDENNSGGFSSKLKKNGSCEPKKHEMQAPGLVARLMGLEAMPRSVAEDYNSNKNSTNHDCNKVKGEKFGSGFNNGLAKEELSLSPEKGNAVRPQKIQKTGFLDRKQVTRFGAEALQIKNVLSRSRKQHHHHHHHHHPKLASPVKSPKMGRNTSRLIDVAARILEPGIQASNRARCSLTYSNSATEKPWKEEVMNKVREDADLETEFLNAQAACRSCGNNLDVDSRDVDFPASSFREVFFHGLELEESRPRPAVYLENENDVVLLRTRYPSECVTTQTEDNRSPVKTEIRNEVHQTQCHEQIPVSRMFTSQKDAFSSINFKHRPQRHGEMLHGDRALPPKSKMTSTQGRRVSSAVNTVNETKDFIALNRNVSRNRLRVPSKSDSSIDADRRFCTGKNDSLTTQRSPVRKRRTLNANKQVDNASTANSSFEKQRTNKVNIVTGNGARIRSTPASQTCLRSRPASQRGNKNTDVVSFTFSSPVKSTLRASDEKGAKRRDPVRITNENLQHKLTTEENGVRKSSQNYLRMNGDALGALLEQKLKELSLQAENEAATGFIPSARTTASILQELISALTVEKPVSCEDGSQGTGSIDSQCESEVADSASQSGQAKLSNKRSSNGFSCTVDHYSPGCVLDASFSNDSCISSSIDDNSVKPVASTDVDIVDSASSTNWPRGRAVMLVTDLVNHTSAVLQNVNCVHSRLTATKLDYFQEIVLNAELLFSNAAVQSSSRILDFLVGPFLDELETLVIAAWKNTIILGIEVRKEDNPLRRFLFDCLVECLDVKYTRYSDSGFRAWSRLPKSIDAEVLIKSFDEEVRKWISFAGNATDTIIEREMSTSLGKWTDFEIETFETGAQISQDIVHNLVDEIVIDLCRSDISVY